MTRFSTSERLMGTRLALWENAVQKEMTLTETDAFGITQTRLHRGYFRLSWFSLVFHWFSNEDHKFSSRVWNAGSFRKPWDQTKHGLCPNERCWPTTPVETPEKTHIRMFFRTFILASA
jgi:hypothetical protein